MSGFKKLRLDPEHSRSLSLPNQSGGASGDSVGRRYLDNNSSLSSSSGGGGGGNGGYSSVVNRSSSGPFRTRYTQPAGGSMSFSRFSPYYFGKERRSSLKVPLIRARRDDSDSERPSSRASLNSSVGGDSVASVTSTTAQRIIETLQNLSTPVMNAGKIRIDQDIKAVQPFFGVGSPPYRTSPRSSLNRSTGPPKMCSSLLLSNPSPLNQTSPLSDSRRIYRIPKMIDAATNTDRERDSSESSNHNQSPPSQLKFGMDFKTSAPKLGGNKPSTASTSTSTSAKSITQQYSKDDKDSDEEEFHECSSDFTFSSAWSPDIFDRYLTNDQNKVGSGFGDRTTQQQQPPLLNGFRPQKDTDPKSMHGFSATGPSNASAGNKPTESFIGGLKPAGSGVFGIASPPKDATKRGSSVLEETSAKKQRSNESPSISFGLSSENKSTGSGFGAGAGPSTFNFGKTATTAATTNQAKSTFSFGSDAPSSKPFPSALDKVDGTKTDISSTSLKTKAAGCAEPKSVLPPLTGKSTEGKWPCPTCMVSNNVSDEKCICCGEKNPSGKAPAPLTASTFTSGGAEAKKKWRCPTCMVENDPVAAACVCCSEKNPNPVSAPAKKWSCPTCLVENDPVAAACVCCSEKNPNPVNAGEGKDSSAPKSEFKFGIGAGAGTSSSNTAGGTSFTFGMKSAETADTKATFSFGAPATTSASSTPSSGTAKAPTFGIKSTASEDSKAAFNFGASSTSATSPPSSEPAKAPAFGFGAPASSATGSTDSKTAAAPSFNFGAPVSSSAGNSTDSKPAAATTFSFGAGSSQPKAESSTAAPSVPTTAAPASGSTFKFGMNAPVNPLSSVKSTTSSPSTFAFGGTPAASKTAEPGSSSGSSSGPTTTTISLFGTAAKPTTTGAGSTAPKTTTSGTVFGAPSTTFSAGSNSTFSFGGGASSSDSQKRGFDFGDSGAPPAKSSFSPATSFSFNSQQNTSATAPAPALGAPSFSFGSTNNPAASPFGQVPQSQPPAATPMFQFGGATPAATPSNPPAPSFSLSPNLNFGAATPGSNIPFGNPTQPTLNPGSQPPPALFQFSATPSTAESSAGRQIKRAVRRFRK